MIRGTTPTLWFDLPIDPNLVDHVYLSVFQRGKEVYTKTEKDMWLEEIPLRDDEVGYRVNVKLTQEETLKLNNKEIVKIQARIKTTTGDALSSNIIVAQVDGLLKDGVI